MITEKAIEKINKLDTELSKTENTKYSTVNGVKEFIPERDGYIDNIYIEGCTKILNTNNEECLPGTEGTKLVSVGQGDKIEVLISSEKTIVKNLSQADYVLGGISGTDGTLQDWNDWQSTKDFMEIYDTDKVLIINNPSYIKDIGVAFYNNEKTFINFATGEDFVNFIPIVKDTKYIKVRIKKNANSIIENFTTTIYSTNQYDKKQILTTCRSVSDSIKDIVYKQGDKYYKIKKCEEITVTGNETTIEINDRLTNCMAFRISCSNIKASNGKSPISDKFIHNYKIEDTEHFYFENGLIVICLLKSRLTSQDVAGFKTWLQANPITIVYELATPVIEELPNFNPRTFDNKTTFLLNSGVVQGKASFEVTNSTRSELEVLKNKVSDLDDSNNFSITIGNHINSPTYKHSKNITLNNISSTFMNEVGINTTGWYTIGEFYFVSDQSSDSVYGTSFIVNISRSYSYSNNESYTFLVNGCYNKLNIIQLNSSVNDQLCKKLRLVTRTNNNTLKIELYIETSVTNIYLVSISNVHVKNCGGIEIPMTLSNNNGTIRKEISIISNGNLISPTTLLLEQQISELELREMEREV